MACTAPSNPGAWEAFLSQHHILPNHAARKNTIHTSAMDHDYWYAKYQRIVAKCEFRVRPECSSVRCADVLHEKKHPYPVNGRT